MGLTQRFLVERIRTTVIDTRRWLDWAEVQPDIDRSRMAVIGFSIGSMVASGVLSEDPRLSGAVLVMGGANFDEIMASCHYEPKDVRRVAAERFGWTSQQFLAAMRPLLRPIEPTRHAAAIDPKRVLIFDAIYDDCIPASSRQALWNVMGRPERISFLLGHKASFLSVTPLGLNFMRAKIYQFLDQTL